MAILWNGPTWTSDFSFSWNGPTAVRSADAAEPKAARAWRKLLASSYTAITSANYAPPGSPASPTPLTPDAPAGHVVRHYEADVRGAMASGELASQLGYSFSPGPPGSVELAQLVGGTICRLQIPTPTMLTSDRTRVQVEVDSFDTSLADEAALVVQDGAPLAPFAYLLGVNAQTRPATTELLSVAVSVLGLHIFRMKDAMQVQRPNTGNVRVLPMLQVPSHLSYPGGHAAKAALAATLLTPLVGNRKAATFLDHTAAFIGDNRVRAGLHFPLDTHAGTMLGESLGRWLIATGSLRGSAPSWQGSALDVDGSVMRRTELASVAGSPDAPVWRGLFARAYAEWQ